MGFQVVALGNVGACAKMRLIAFELLLIDLGVQAWSQQSQGALSTVHRLARLSCVKLLNHKNRS